MSLYKVIIDLENTLLSWPPDHHFLDPWWSAPYYARHSWVLPFCVPTILCASLSVASLCWVKCIRAWRLWALEGRCSSICLEKIGSSPQYPGEFCFNTYMVLMKPSLGPKRESRGGTQGWSRHSPCHHGGRCPAGRWLTAIGEPQREATRNTVSGSRNTDPAERIYDVFPKITVGLSFAW